MDHIIKIEYQNNGAIIDINGHDLKASTYARVYLNSFNFFPEADRRDAEFYGYLCLAFAFGGMSFWITISVFSK